jgi:transcription termination factor Rho
MSVLDRSELEASPLADLHAIADQLGLDGFRRLRKGDLIDAILGEPSRNGGESSDSGRDPDRSARTSADGESEGEGASDRSRTGTAAAPRKRRTPRLRRGARASEEAEGESSSSTSSSSSSSSAGESSGSSSPPSSVSSRRGGGGGGGSGEKRGEGGGRGNRAARPGGRAGASPSKRAADDAVAADDAPRSAEGVVELLGNGSAFLRVDPPEPSDDDVYISAAQVRRCELVSGDRVTGPVRTPRRSERYPSLVRVDTINGSSADEVSEGAHYEDLPVAYPSERLALNAGDPTLDAIEWLTPLGRGSRAVIVGPPRAGKTETLRRLLGAVIAAAAAAGDASEAADRTPADWPGATTTVGAKAGSLEVTVVLAGARPEEIAEWRDGPTAPVAALSFAASADAQGQAVERAIEAAKRVAARGGDAVVLIDGLDGMHPPAARKTLAAARNLRDGGSLTVIATAARPFGGETTVIALDAGLTDSGLPILDLAGSGTLKAELLVGEDGARAIAKARAEARGA